MRNIDATTLAALGQKDVRMIALVKMEFRGYPVTLFTTYNDDIVFGGETYVATGSLGSISPVQEKNDLTPSDYTITLNGQDTDVAVRALNAPQLNNPVTVWLQTLDEDYRPQGEPYIYFKGLTDTVEVSHGKESVIAVGIRDRLSDWQNPRMSRYTDAEQRILYPDDKGFEYVTEISSREVEWPKDTWFQKNSD